MDEDKNVWLALSRGPSSNSTQSKLYCQSPKSSKNISITIPLSKTLKKNKNKTHYQ
jgi:hypothetical protein